MLNSREHCHFSRSHFPCGTWYLRSLVFSARTSTPFLCPSDPSLASSPNSADAPLATPHGSVCCSVILLHILWKTDCVQVWARHKVISDGIWGKLQPGFLSIKEWHQGTGVYPVPPTLPSTAVVVVGILVGFETPGWATSAGRIASTHRLG